MGRFKHVKGGCQPPGGGRWGMESMDSMDSMEESGVETTYIVCNSSLMLSRLEGYQSFIDIIDRLFCCPVVENGDRLRSVTYLQESKTRALVRLATRSLFPFGSTNQLQSLSDFLLRYPNFVDTVEIRTLLDQTTLTGDTCEFIFIFFSFSNNPLSLIRMKGGREAVMQISPPPVAVITLSFAVAVCLGFPLRGVVMVFSDGECGRSGVVRTSPSLVRFDIHMHRDHLCRCM